MYVNLGIVKKIKALFVVIVVLFAICCEKSLIFVEFIVKVIIEVAFYF